MTDLIERLRENVAEVPDTYWPGRMKAYAAEAADEIERLQERFDLALRKNGEQWAEIKRLQAVVDAANNLFCWGMGIEGKQSYVKITEQSWEPFEKALAALEDDDG